MPCLVAFDPRRVFAQGEYAQADDLYRQALAIDERAYGRDHPIVAKDISNHAGLLYRQVADFPRKCWRENAAFRIYKRSASTWCYTTSSRRERNRYRTSSLDIS